MFSGLIAILESYATKHRDYVVRLVSGIQEMLDLHCEKAISHRKVHKGEMWLVAFGHNIGSEINNTRPAVIISSGSINSGNTVIVIPIVSDKSKTPAFSFSIAPSPTTGIMTSSFAKIDQIRAVAKQRLQKKIRKLDTIRELEACVMMNCLISDAGLEQWFATPVGEQSIRRYQNNKQDKKKNGT